MRSPSWNQAHLIQVSVFFIFFVLFLLCNSWNLTPWTNNSTYFLKSTNNGTYFLKSTCYLSTISVQSVSICIQYVFFSSIDVYLLLYNITNYVVFQVRVRKHLQPSNRKLCFQKLDFIVANNWSCLDVVIKWICGEFFLFLANITFLFLASRVSA